jgi:hypothetical protein
MARNYKTNTKPLNKHTMTNTKVNNMRSPKGNLVANQFIVHTPEATYFQSYESVIIKTTFENGERVVYLDEYYWNYSKTTSKYRSEFLGENTKETKEKIQKGIYKLTNLN